MDFRLLVDGLKNVAVHPLALAGYALLLVVWAIQGYQVSRLREARRAIASLPEAQRYDYLTKNLSADIPKDGLTADQYLLVNRRRLLGVAFLVTALLIIVLAAFAVFYAKQAGDQEIQQQEIKAKLESKTREFDAQTATTLKLMDLSLRITRMGASSSNSNSFKEAAAALFSAVQAHPSYPEYMHLGYVYEELSDTASAISVYQKAADLEPEKPEPLNNLGALYMDTGDLSKASTSLESALALAKAQKPEDSDLIAMVQGNMGNLLYEQALASQDKEDRLKKLLAAISAYQAAAASPNVSDPVRILLEANIANSYAKANDFDRAAPLFEKVIAQKRRAAMSRSLAETLNNDAEMWIRKGDLKRAAALLDESEGIFTAVDNKIGIAVSALNRGDIACLQKDPKSAKVLYERAEAGLRTAGADGSYLADASKRVKALPECALD